MINPTVNGTHFLHERHRDELKRSGLTDETILAAGIRSVEDQHAIAGILNRKTWSRRFGGVICFPFHDESGAVVLQRVKPDHPPTIEGRTAKYLSPTGMPMRVYFPPGSRELLVNIDQPIIVTEGEKKSLSANQAGFVCIGLCGADCWHAKKSSALLADLERIRWAGREVNLCFDSDAVDNENVRDNERLLAAALEQRGATVRIVRLPAGPNGEKVGLDDYLVAHGSSAFALLLKSAELPTAPDPGEVKTDAGNLDPATEAAAYLETGKADGVSRLRFWQGGFLFHVGGRYRDLSSPEVRGHLVCHLNNSFSRLTTRTTSDVLDQLKAQSLLSGLVSPPSWIERRPGDWPAHETIAMKNGLLHLPSLANGQECQRPHTPRFFTRCALEFDYLRDAPAPAAWLNFLATIWPDDQESIDALQDWFGLCLTPDTRLQKILAIVGPKRSGKGTIARVLTALLGSANVTAPTLSGLATNFGMWSLLDKLLAIISDARMGARTDSSIVVERLLSISGEDALTVDRKNLPPVTTKLPTRIMLLTNELPRLGDASGAMASRFILLRLCESFYGREDHALTDRLLLELPGVLLWAVEGWRRLRDRGRILQPQSGLELLGQLEDLSSPVGLFIRERCITGMEYRASVADLFAAWCDWCEKNGRREHGTGQTFGRDLIAALPHLRKVQPKDDFGERYRAYDGIGILTNSTTFGAIGNA